jgi:hypothetical protein
MIPCSRFLLKSRTRKYVLCSSLRHGESRPRDLETSPEKHGDIVEERTAGLIPELWLGFSSQLCLLISDTHQPSFEFSIKFFWLPAQKGKKLYNNEKMSFATTSEFKNPVSHSGSSTGRDVPCPVADNLYPKKSRADAATRRASGRCAQRLPINIHMSSSNPSLRARASVGRRGLPPLSSIWLRTVGSFP